MNTLVDINRAPSQSSDLYPQCHLTVKESFDGKLFQVKTSLGHYGISLTEFEARVLYETLARRFGKRCTSCDRRDTVNQRTAEAFEGHFGLTELVNLDLADVVAKIGLRETGELVRDLACTVGERDATEVLRTWEIAE